MLLLEDQGKTVLDASQTQKRNQVQDVCCKEWATSMQATKKSQPHNTPQIKQVRIAVEGAVRKKTGGVTLSTRCKVTEQWGCTRKEEKCPLYCVI